MVDTDILYEIRKAKRALVRIEKRILADQRQKTRIERKRQEHLELKRIAEEARNQK